MTQHVLNQQNYKLGNMFQLQRAIIRPTRERSPGTFSDCARTSVFIWGGGADFADLIHVVSLTVIKLLHYYNTQRDGCY